MLEKSFTLKIKVRHIVILAAALLAVILAFFIIAPSAADMTASWLTVRNNLEKCDVIFVHGGSEKRRVPFALNLYKQGYGGRFVTSIAKPDRWEEEAWEKYGVKTYPEILIEAMLKTERIDAASIVILRDSLSTLDDMKRLREYHDSNKFTSVLIITDPVHSRRSMFCAHKFFKDTDVKLISWPLPLEGFKEKFSDREDYWNYTIDELLRNLYYGMGLRKI
ncbi:MAG: YdcF family protein [Vulcanimicrobiota bacterium]